MNNIADIMIGSVRAQVCGCDYSVGEDISEEELDEVRAAMLAGDEAQIAEEMGDLLLTVVSLSRKLHVNAELALTAATDKFIARFAAVEQAVNAAGKRFEDLSDAELDVFWQKCKKITKK